MNLTRTKIERQMTNRRSTLWVLVVGIIFVSVNMRAPLTSVGPLIGFIRDDLHISNAMAGIITTLPLLAFAFFSPIVPKLGKRFGLENVIFVSMIFLAAGIGLRSLSGITTLYVGTAILGLAIAVANVLLPSLVKRDFPKRIGLMTGVYSISMNLLGALASGISVPIAVGLGLGWQVALGLWGVLSLLSVFIWLPQMKRSRQESELAEQQVKRVQQESELAEQQVKRVQQGSGLTDQQAVAAVSQGRSLWRSALAWQVTLFMGLQSTLFYVLVTWLPEMLMQQGVSSEQSGWLLSIMQFAILPCTFIVPIIAGRMTSQRLLVSITGVLFLSGFAGLMYGSANVTVLWIILLGMGVGFAFGLAMVFFGLRTSDARGAAELSGMAQSIGYLLAATGPMLFGYLHDVTQGWTVPLYILIGISMLLLVFGLGAARNKQIER